MFVLDQQEKINRLYKVLLDKTLDNIAFLAHIRHKTTQQESSNYKATIHEIETYVKTTAVKALP